MKTRTFTLAIFSFMAFISCKEEKKEVKESPATADTKTEMISEDTDEWLVLFDGSSTDAWHGYNEPEDTFPENWKVEGDALVFYPKEGENHTIVTDEEFTSFILSLEWKISEGGNSGIMWAVQEMPEYNRAYYTGPEIQVLDNQKHPDANVGGKTHQAGALYDMVPPSEDVSSPLGSWNTYEIEINHNTKEGRVTHNGVVVTEFPLDEEAWKAMVANSKFADWKDFAGDWTGKIALQDHDDKVAYRNIKIKKL
ncbi:3-keto-disaccharide hydrolase [Robertkochia aurantiaca]|uniref:3-keto-disaccharide hydrolase n=1 Tax=Robertkochia aurantiaca TaxID=2873700 RepID=UPI001CCC9E86|nr:DUF1080 domain-containing protein [Robertkochia sp. 3YJGBD-33]